MRYWKRVTGSVTTTVESYSHDIDINGAIEISKAEFDAYIASFPPSSPSSPPSFLSHTSGLPDRVARIESFLTMLYL